MFSPLDFLLLAHELVVSDQSVLLDWGNDKSSDDELAKIRKNKEEIEEEEREGGEGSSFSHRQW